MPVRPPVFRARGARTPEQREQQYDARRGSARKRGYTPLWDQTSTGFLNANPLCLGCEAVGRVTPATVCDHTVPHRGDMALFWDPQNRQPACKPHHDIVKQVLEQHYARGELPASALRLDSPAAQALTRAILPF